MTKKKSKIDLSLLKKVWPYALTAAVTLAVVFVGSIDKNNSSSTLSLNAMAANGYENVSVDQISGFYTVANVADALSLASASDVASNYVVVTSMYESGLATGGKIEKPTITNIVVSRGVVTYVVKEGDTMDLIASRYGLTTDQVRWSNGLKTTEVSTGGTLYLPSVPGIVYTVKEGDTIESIASKYGSTAAEITALNDLEVSGITQDMKIVIKNGTLPETERPEYVAPTRYYYTYLGDTSERQNITIVGYKYGLGGPYGGGQCTQWAWYNRQDLPSNLGNANTWAARASAAGYAVDHVPSQGAIFQTASGRYGHVGYVEAVNADGSITVTEMNYNYRAYLVIRATIPADKVGNFSYIH